MKKILKKISLFWILTFPSFFPSNTKASKSNVTERVNNIRHRLQEKIKKGDVIELKKDDFYSGDKVSEWINWGNWGNWGNWNNWNNWNDWAKWAKWNDWNNWNNWRNY
jgi:hypothetical protein